MPATTLSSVVHTLLACSRPGALGVISSRHDAALSRLPATDRTRSVARPATPGPVAGSRND
jgi:hypothetical protein